MNEKRHTGSEYPERTELQIIEEFDSKSSKRFVVYMVFRDGSRVFHSRHSHFVLAWREVNS